MTASSHIRAALRDEVQTWSTRGGVLALAAWMAFCCCERRIFAELCLATVAAIEPDSTHDFGPDRSHELGDDLGDDPNHDPNHDLEPRPARADAAPTTATGACRAGCCGGGALVSADAGIPPRNAPRAPSRDSSREHPGRCTDDCCGGGCCTKASHEPPAWSPSVDRLGEPLPPAALASAPGRCGRARLASSAAARDPVPRPPPRPIVLVTCRRKLAEPDAA